MDEQMMDCGLWTPENGCFAFFSLTLGSKASDWPAWSRCNCVGNSFLLTYGRDDGAQLKLLIIDRSQTTHLRITSAIHSALLDLHGTKISTMRHGSRWNTLGCNVKCKKLCLWNKQYIIWWDVCFHGHLPDRNWWPYSRKRNIAEKSLIFTVCTLLLCMYTPYLAELLLF